MKVKAAKFKAVKFKPSQKMPHRGAGGRFVAKAKLTGTSKIKTFFDTIEDSAFEIAKKEVRGVATAAADDIRRGVIYQTVPPMGGKIFDRSRRFDTPLHPFTVKEKARKRRDPRNLISTGFYVEHIGVMEEKKGKGYTYRVGYTTEEHPSGIAMGKLGRILEYGTRIKVTPRMRRYLAWRGLFLRAETEYITIPARPHFGPTLVRLRRHLRKISQWKSKSLTAALRKEMGL
jgi:hypothetical protein